MCNPLFHEVWWLDAVSPSSWGEVVLKQGDDIVARLPYAIRKRFGFTILSMPSLTPYLGPWIRKSNVKYTYRLAEQKKLFIELIDGLPRFDYFCLDFSPEITNWLPFYWKGYHQVGRYTYTLDNLSNEKSLWGELRPNIRREIKKAKNRYNLQIRIDLDVDRFYDLNRMTFERQSKTMPYSRDFVRRLDAACVLHDARRIFYAVDDQDCIHAAAYIVWDKHCAYYLMGGSDPSLRTSGAMSLCMWEAILFSAKVTKRFDFEGSMIEPVERFFRGFGAVQTPYFRVTKTNGKLLKSILFIKDQIF